MGLKSSSIAMLKLTLAPIIYRHISSGLHPERLQLYLGQLIACRDVPGDVVEVGVNLGGTAVYAARLLRRLGIDKSYTGYDTFGGFVPEQFETDRKRGTPSSYSGDFSASSVRLVRRILDLHGGEAVGLVQGDIVTMPEDRLPDVISNALVDVDLSDPTFHALTKIYGRLADGGIVLVDDCPDGDEERLWHARDGYRRFAAENGLEEEYLFGMGVVRGTGRG